MSKNVFKKSKGNILSSEEFKEFVCSNGIKDFYIVGGDAIVCVKSSIYNLLKENYQVTVLSDCITSYDKKKINAMLEYYENKGSKLMTLDNLLG